MKNFCLTALCLLMATIFAGRAYAAGEEADMEKINIGKNWRFTHRW